MYGKNIVQSCFRGSPYVQVHAYIFCGVRRVSMSFGNFKSFLEQNG